MTTTRITNDEQALLDSRLTSHERRVLDWYRQFEDTYAEKLQVNYKIHTSLSTAIKNCDVRELAWQMQRAIQHRAWEDMPEYPGSPTQGKVLHLSFTEWVEEYLFTNVDGLVRIMSGHLPQANEAGEAVIAVIDAVHAEDPQMLKTLMSDYSTEGSNLPGWQKLIASKAAECNGKWTEAASHLADITAGKVGAPEGNDNAAKDKNNAPSGGALNDDSKQAGKRQPKSERQRGGNSCCLITEKNVAHQKALFGERHFNTAPAAEQPTARTAAVQRGRAGGVANHCGTYLYNQEL